MQGTATDASASLNYSLQNYANDVVAALQVLCKTCLFVSGHLRACTEIVLSDADHRAKGMQACSVS